MVRRKVIPYSKIEELQDMRLSQSEIARRLNVTPQAISQRIKHRKRREDLNNKQTQEFREILREAGYQRNVSFKSGNNRQLLFLHQIAKERFGGNFSAAVIEATECLEYITKTYGDWRTMDKRPAWVSEIVNQLKQVKIVAGDGSQDTEVEQAVSQALQLSEELFE